MLELYWGNSCFILVLLTILLLRIRHSIQWDPGKKYAVIFVCTVEFYVFLDALFIYCFLTPSVSVRYFKTVVFLFYLIYVLTPYIWHLFMQHYMEIHRSGKFHCLETVPLILLLAMVITSIPTGSIWGFAEDGTYTRGALFSVFAVCNLFYYVFAFVQTLFYLLHRHTRQVCYLVESSLFSAIPLIGILVNTYVIPLYGVWPFQPYCLTVGVLLSYLFMVEHQQNRAESEHRDKLSAALELEKKASRKAQAASQVKNNFLANMSHDIRTPMNAIIGFSNIIAEHPEDAEIVRTSIAKIQTSGEILLKLINDVLDLSKIESGKVELKETATDLLQVATNLETILDYSLKKADIRYHFIQHLQNSCVWCDTTKLQQILVNTLNNAVKFTPEGGNITLSFSQEAYSATHGKYILSVKDTGIGMDEAFQKHAFEAFEREHTSTDSKIEGTGLGLAIVKKLVDLMDGRIMLHSKPGEGTEISIELILKYAIPEEIPRHVQKSTVPLDLHGVRALLAEDNDLNAEIAVELLKKTGLQIDRVSDGVTCVRQLAQMDENYYQFILMDIQMPELNGYQATTAIRNMKDPVRSRIPIIAMTANAFEEDRQQALQAGMNGFIPKPLDVQQMYQVLQNIL